MVRVRATRPLAEQEGLRDSDEALEPVVEEAERVDDLLARAHLFPLDHLLEESGGRRVGCEESWLGLGLGLGLG